MRGVWMLFVVMGVCGIAWSAEQPAAVLPFPNGGFEDGLSGWRTPPGEGMSRLSTERAAGGRRSLHIRDADAQRGSDATGPRVRITGRGAYELRGKVYPVSGTGLGMYVRVLDRDGKPVGPQDAYHRGLGGRSRRWEPFAISIYTGSDAAYLQLWIHSYGHAQVEAYVDDLQFVSLGSQALRPPWEGQYKIRPEQKDKLTAADVVGPDGLVYPNWTQCGVQGGIPRVGTVAARIEDFGGKADDDADDSAALDAACRAAGDKDGGVVLLGEGRYNLDRPVTVRSDGVVIRGQGRDKTRLLFRYHLPESGIAFYAPREGATVGPDSIIELHCLPAKLARMQILAGDRLIRQWERSTHSGNTFSLAIRGRELVGRVPDGPVILTGIAEYDGGAKRTCQVRVKLDRAARDPQPIADTRAAITFDGRGPTGPRLRLTRDAKRGDTVLQLERTEGLAAGDCIIIDGPATPRWKQLTRNACPWGNYRRYEVRIERVDHGNRRITLAQPVRIEFPVVDGSTVQKTVPIQRCGIEDLSIEQTHDLWITTVLFSRAWNCWARGVTVTRCGRNPIYPASAKWCEIRDCVFDDAWFKGGGGTAYAGWEMAWDCLMENVETFKLRHAPLFQWAASGNVIRKSVFHESDGQWHSGWTNENLMEQCVIESSTGNGAYGYGLWASPPEDDAHGPNGPRNVVYNCDIRSPKAGLWMGGMNEHWLILHNRFVVEQGPGVYAKTASFDHIIHGNVFVLKDGKSPMVHLATPDCIGVEITANKLHGGGERFANGLADPAIQEANDALPLTAPAPRPQPRVPSIYEWQQRNRRR